MQQSTLILFTASLESPMASMSKQPPTRQLHINGFLGPAFPLGSGVAQGCPLSPLLFLIIAEPMARLINNNKNIEGIITKTKSSKGIKTVRHKISQFADDSTFILRRGDVSAALATLALWCAATGMRENEKKREVMLLGSMRERDAAGNLG